MTNKANELSEKLNLSNPNMLDALVSHGLINGRTRAKHSSKPRRSDIDLLTKVLPRTDDVGYAEFCCMLRAKPYVSTIGKQLCDQCQKCLWAKCEMNESVHFVFDPSCKQFLESWEATFQSIFANVTINVDFVNETVLSQSPLVYNASLVCVNNTILAYAKLGVEEEGVNKEMFTKNLASLLNVSSSEITITFCARGSTWIYLSLSAEAGLKLLTIFGTTKSQYELGQSIAEALISNEDKVSVEVQISDLPTFVMSVVPSNESVGGNIQSGKYCLFAVRLTICTLLNFVVVFS